MTVLVKMALIVTVSSSDSDYVTESDYVCYSVCDCDFIMIDCDDGWLLL